MARILTIVTLLLASALTAQAVVNCQCLFQDGSHCCVYVDARTGDVGCQNVCRDAHRIDGVACNAGGKFSTVSAWNAQFRTGCLRQ